MRLFAFVALLCAMAFPAYAQTAVACPAPSATTVCFQFPNAPIVGFSWSPPGIPPSALADAVARAKPGETIRVTAGAPADVVIRGLAFSPAITITSADPAHRAVLNSLQLIGVAGVNVTGVDAHLANPANSASQVVTLTNSSAIAFLDSNITGSADPSGKCGWFGKGFAITGGDHISFTGGSLSNLNKGFSLGGGQYVTLQGADLHDINTSPVDGGGDAAHLQFLSNYIHDLVPVIACGQHSDGWHMWSKNSKGPIDDVVIRGNRFTQAYAPGSLGINVEGTSIAGGTGFTHMVIDSNILRWNNNQGITTNYTEAAITNNLLAPTPVLDDPKHAPAFVARLGSMFVITGNTWKCGPSSKPYPQNTCLTAQQIADYGAAAPR